MAVALLTNSLLRSAVAIMHQDTPFDLTSFFDLSACFEAVALFDDLDIAVAANPVAEATIASICSGSTAPKLRFVEPGAQFDAFMRKIADAYGRAPWGNPLVRSAPEAEDLAPLFRILPKDSVHLFVQQICCLVEDAPVSDAIDWIQYMHQLPSYPDEWNVPAAYVMRTIAYFWLAIHERRHFFPDFHRVPYAAAYADLLQSSLSRDLHQHLAHILAVDLEIIQREARSVTVPIPPITALVLGEASSIDEIPPVLSAIRGRLAKLRAQAEAIDKEITCAESIVERQKAIERKHEIFRQATRDSKTREGLTYKAVLEFAEHLARPVAEPLNPTSYSKALLEQPADWLRRWWLRRPLMPLYRIDRKIRHYPDYDRLIEKHWGKKAQEGAREAMAFAFGEHAAGIARLFSII